jgi:molecular chaperone GrpE (heat shock protein)
MSESLAIPLPPDEPAPPPDDSPPPDHDTATAAAIAALAEQIGREHERSAHREQVIDRLHAENQELRHGLLNEAMTPVRAGLYRLYDVIRREAARRHDSDGPAEQHVPELLDALAEEVADVLARTGADRLPVRPGDPYDPSVHRPVSAEPVEAGRHGTVVALVSDGFRMEERVLRKAGVVVGKAAERSM